MRRALKLMGWAFLGVLAVALVLAWRGLGHRASGDRLERMRKSAQWQDGRFENPEPLWNDIAGFFTRLAHVSDHTTPTEPVPTTLPTLSAPQSGLRITWLGHSTTLVEIDGVRLLTDPVWSERVTPVRGFGPKRYYEPLMALPQVDAVLISHDHYDHLDEPTVMLLKDRTFIVPLGVGAHLAYWGVPESHIIEKDWWEETRIKGVDIVTTPARHASGRAVWDKDATLWAGYAIKGPEHRVYYSGDTGLFNAMHDIGERHGPFDVAMIEVGQYDQSWPDWHIGPEQAVTASKWVRAKTLLPVHWGLFTLAYHGWTEPIERTLAAAGDVHVITPLPGQSVENFAAPAARWWPNVPWETWEKNPVVSTNVRGVSSSPAR